MPYIYKPSTQSMYPNQDIIDPSIDNKFIATISGQSCVAYRFRVFNMDNEVIEIASTNKVELEKQLYNDDVLTHVLPRDKLKAGADYKWSLDMYANDLSVTLMATAISIVSVDVTGNKFKLGTISGRGINAGDACCIKSTASMPAPIVANATYYCNVETDVNKNNYLILYNSRSEALAKTNPIDITSVGSGTLSVIINELFTANNHNLYTGDIIYINTVPDVLSKEIFSFKPYYIGKVDNNTFNIYEYLEGARNAEGSIPIGTGGNFVFSLSNIAQSQQVVFKAYNKPVITFLSEIINSPSHDFAPIYAQEQGVIVNSYEVSLKNNFNDDTYNTGIIYSSKMEFHYDELLNGQIYYVKFDIVDNIGQKSTTGYIPFGVKYNVTKMGIIPSAVNNAISSSIRLSWSKTIQINGQIAGDYEFIDNYKVDENSGLKLFSKAQLRFDKINKSALGSLPMFGWSPLSDTWSGVIYKMQNSETSEYFELSYSNGMFYKNINGIKIPILKKALKKHFYYYLGFDGTQLIVVDSQEQTVEYGV